jgi:Uncharacterised ArCR, COG2043
MTAEPDDPDGGARRPDVAATHQLGRRLLALWPERPAPVGITRVHDVPAHIPTRSGPALSACRLWREATTRVFAVGSTEVVSLRMAIENHTAVLYGPLHRLPIRPEAVLFIAVPAQAALVADALGQARSNRGGMTELARPLCADVAAAITGTEPCAWFAGADTQPCCELSGDELVVVVPGAWIGLLAYGIDRALLATPGLHDLMAQGGLQRL